jgi:hypothetical protein
MTCSKRVLTEEPRDVAFYLDSGWPGDNYETTVGMAMALLSRGWVFGHNLLHLAYPHAKHGEPDWAMRMHIPLQMVAGSVAGYSRMRVPILRERL